MHIRRLRIQDIRSIRNLEIEIPEPRAGWHVILGDNGSGKSSVMRALALALMGPSDAAATRQDWPDWIRKGAPEARVAVEIAHQAPFDKWKGTGRRTKTSFKVSVALRAPSGAVFKGAIAPQFTGRSGGRTIWGRGAGWFCASFGPFRRFSGGDKEYDRLFYSNPGLARHLSAFGEDVALGEALRWLQDLQFKRYENDDAATRLLDALVDFLRQSQLLPHGAHIKDITSEAVLFSDGADVPVPVEQLSDGFRSVLSMTFELLRGMVAAYGNAVFLDALDARAGAVNLPGVVAIDEVDAHLHPAWQKRIGDWLIERFPMVQFFVTTHSPIICRSAARGSIWRLPTPGTGEEAHQIEGPNRDRLVNGSILDAFDTEYFGSPKTGVGGIGADSAGPRGAATAKGQLRTDPRIPLPGRACGGLLRMSGAGSYGTAGVSTRYARPPLGSGPSDDTPAVPPLREQLWGSPKTGVGGIGADSAGPRGAATAKGQLRTDPRIPLPGRACGGLLRMSGAGSYGTAGVSTRYARPPLGSGPSDDTPAVPPLREQLWALRPGLDGGVPAVDDFTPDARGVVGAWA